MSSNTPKGWLTDAGDYAAKTRITQADITTLIDRIRHKKGTGWVTIRRRDKSVYALQLAAGHLKAANRYLNEAGLWLKNPKQGEQEHE